MVSAMYIASLCTTWWTFLAFYGFMYPCGIGIVYYTAIICSWEWFPERKGLAGGMIFGSYGFGGFIFGFISTAIVNPNNVQPNKDKTSPEYQYFPPEVAMRVPEMLQICTIIWASLCVIAIFCVSRNPECVAKAK